MRTVALLLLLFGLLLFVGPCPASANTRKCDELARKMERALREWAANHAICTDDDGSETTRDACELANLFADQYLELYSEHKRKCEPLPLRAE